MDIQREAKTYGFAACYVFSTEPFTRYAERLENGALHSAAFELTIDPGITAPWANAILALVYPYRPFADDIPVSGNYPSSNAAYHASGRLMRRLRDLGIQAERAEVPMRELLTRNGVGVSLKNGLTNIPRYGTRYSARALFANLPEPEYTRVLTPEPSRCSACRACERICPSAAIDADGYHFRRCARAYMGGDPMEVWVMDAMSCILGCELCQKVCPYNAGIEPVNEMPEAFRLEMILSGNVKPALEIVGKNLNKQGRIIQHACVIAAHTGRADLIPLIEPWREDKREAVRVAADYALRKLSGLKKIEQ